MAAGARWLQGICRGVATPALPLRGVSTRVMFGCLFRMMFRMQVMTMRHMGMMGGLFMIARFMMLRRFGVVFAGVFVMLGGLLVMFTDGVFHVPFPLLSGFIACRVAATSLP